MNKTQKGPGDPLINELERIMGGKDYPLDLIGLICKEKNISFKLGKQKGLEDFVDLYEKNNSVDLISGKGHDNVVSGIGYHIPKIDIYHILSKLGYKKRDK